MTHRTAGSETTAHGACALRHQRLLREIESLKLQIRILKTQARLRVLNTVSMERRSRRRQSAWDDPAHLEDFKL